MNETTRPRVLMITPQSPYPPRQGAALRNYHLLARLARHASVDLLTFVDPGQPRPEQSPLGTLCHHVYAHPTPSRSLLQRLQTLLLSLTPDLVTRLDDEAMHRLVGDLAKGTAYDVILVEGLEVAAYAFTYLAHLKNGERPRLVYDAHNAEYMLQMRAFVTDAMSPLRWPAAMYSLLQWLKLRRYERWLCQQADHVVAVSEADRDNLRRLGVETPITVVPNAVDVAYYDEYNANGPTDIAMSPMSLVFTGKMDFRPNVDAVLWFLDEVWPRVRQAIPDAQFYVVGRSPHKRLFSRAETPGLFITGEVPDVRPYLKQAQVYVAPLRVGGGTRLKLLEAMAMRKAIVSTTVGAEGYPVEPGKHLFIADDAASFAEAIVILLEDPDLRDQLGEAAHAFVAEHYDWDAVFPRFLEALGLSPQAMA